MKIERATWVNKSFSDAEEAGAYARARAIEKNFHLLTQDIVQLNNTSSDANASAATIVLDQVSLPKNADREPGHSEVVRDIESVPFSGELTLDAKNNPVHLTMNMESSDSLDARIQAHTDHGFLHLGQEQLTIEQVEFGSSFAEVATFFADGSIGYQMKCIDPWT